MVPKNCPYAAPFALFRAPAESGRGIFFRFSFLYGFINSCIQTFREPYAALLPLQQNIHIHICRCHSDTRSLAWVLGRLPYIYISIYIYIYLYIYHVWNKYCAIRTRSGAYTRSSSARVYHVPISLIPYSVYLFLQSQTCGLDQTHIDIFG